MNKQDNTSLVPVSAQEQMTKPAVKTWRPVIFIGFLVLLGFFGGFGGWAAVAPLGSGAIAVGQVQVASQQKMLQSKDGGVITALHVRNGDIVKSGQILVDLDATQLQVQLNLLTGQLWNFLGREARLRAERQKADSIQFSDILLEARGRPEVAEIIQGETRLFESRRAALRSQLSLLERRVAKTREEITAHRAEQKADGRQLVLIEEEITAKRELVEKGLERRPRLLALQRQQAALEGSIGNRVALVARAEQSIAEITFQRHGLLDEREAEIEAALADTRDQISQIKDRLTIANDNLMHSKIRAPNDGKVYGMRFHTVGGVIPPREIILGIVPVDDSLNIQVRIDPADIDVVKVGSLAMVRLTSFSQRTFKPIEGELVRISADVVADSVTGPYYEGEIILDRDRLADQPGLELLQGMPAMAIISTGDQTMLEYLMAPILRSIDTSLREN